MDHYLVSRDTYSFSNCFTEWGDCAFTKLLYPDKVLVLLGLAKMFYLHGFSNVGAIMVSVLLMRLFYSCKRRR